MNPISSYRERMLQVKRRFELYPDRVDIAAKWLFKGRFDTSVKLSELDPQYRSFYVRNKLFKPSVVIVLTGVVLLFLSGDEERLRASSPLAVLGLTLALAGAACTWLTSHRIRFVQFQSRSGRARLDIACAGPDKESFDSFVGQVQQRIRHSLAER
jgi:hypothetical protein